MKALYYLPLLLLVLTLAYGLDQDGDDISDVYAAYYGVTAGTGAEDPDGDSQTTAEESAWGTNPFDSSSKQTTSYSLIGSLYDFSVQTIAGKRYQFEGTSDLMAPWEEFDIPFEGTGNIEHLLITLPIVDTTKHFWRVKALPESDLDGDSLGAYEETLLSTLDTKKDTDDDKVSDLAEFLYGLNPALYLDTDGDGLSDDWETFSGTDPNDDGSIDPDNGPNGDINGDGISNMMAYNSGVRGSTTIGPQNLDIGQSMSGGVVKSFRVENDPNRGYPADLYDDISVDGWRAVIGDFIEIWDEDDEGIFDTFIELQSHWNADGIKQDFEMLPDSQESFILAYKGRYDLYDFSDSTDNAFSLKVEGAAELLIDGASATLPDGSSGKSFMDDEDTNQQNFTPKYPEWTFTNVTIKAGPEATNNDGSVDVNLSLVPNELTNDNGEEVTYGGFVQLLKVDVAVDSSSDPETAEFASVDSTSSKQHFVTAARQGDVVLRADAPDSIQDQITWETTADGISLVSPAIGNDKRTVKVDTNAEFTKNGAKIPYKIKLAGQTVKEGVIWTVWGDIEVSSNLTLPYEGYNDSVFVAVEQVVPITFYPKPSSIFVDVDRPDITAESTALIPGSGQVHPHLGNGYEGGAKYMLDASRAYKLTTSFPEGLSIDDINFPEGVTDPPASVSYPNDLLFGNDDTGLSDPSDPSDLPENGYIYIEDRPRIPIDHDKIPTNLSDNILDWNLTFRHFLRLEVGGQWYIASEFVETDFDFSLEFENGKWSLQAEQEEENQ